MNAYLNNLTRSQWDKIDHVYTVCMVIVGIANAIGIIALTVYVAVK